MRTCKREGCSNQRRIYEYSCLPCKRVGIVTRIARELMVEMVGNPKYVYFSSEETVRIAWDTAEVLVSKMDKELGYG